jgi:hypothetical protein
MRFALALLVLAPLGCATTADTGGPDDAGRPDRVDDAGGGDVDGEALEEEGTEAGDDGGRPFCDDPTACDGGPCVDGTCCDGPCDGPCEACNVPGAEGTCTAIPYGDDPDEECIEEFPATCGTRGVCDGARACAMFGAETPCDDGNPCTTDDACDGSGSCYGYSPTACEPGSGNQCCTGACDAASGCFTGTGECAETCETNRLVVGLVCVGCGPAAAVGLCTGGTTHDCTATAHPLCEEVRCGGATYYCTNAGGTWAWRTGVACDDEQGCTYTDACFGGACTGTSYACVSEPCLRRTCDGAGGCDEVPSTAATECGTVACPPDSCSGTTWYDYAAECTSRCDGGGNCVACTCLPTATTCSVGPANVCCTAACSAATGCRTVPASCGSADACTDPYSLTVGSVCNGCGPAGANGVCGGGGTFVCNGTTHTECQTIACGGTTFYCTRLGGIWQWRASANCDDGSSCTWGDACGASGCVGTAIDCTSTDCLTRSCNGTSACSEIPRPPGTSCGSSGCLPDSCSSGTWFNYPASCASTCDGAGACNPCSCTPTTTACVVGAGNECCAAECSPTAGCSTSFGLCADSCADPNVLTAGRVCTGCGPNGASGDCAAGTTTTCNTTTHSTCQSVTCGGSAYTCTNLSGTWQWRSGDSRCDDGNLCTANDRCTGASCAGTIVDCTSTPPCITRACNGTATCTVTYNTGTGCDDGDACTTGETCNASGGCTGGISSAVCPDGACNCGETRCTCEADCGAHCGNSVCDCGETGATCPADCAVCPAGLVLSTWDSGTDGWVWDDLWRRSGGALVAGAGSGHCSGSYTDNLTYPTDVDLSGCTTATLRFSARLADDAAWDRESSTDKNQRLYVECSGDSGGSWTSLVPSPWPTNQSACATSYCDGNLGLDRSFSWTSQAITLPAACRTTRVRFRFRANGTCIWDLMNPGWYVDSVSLN